MMGGGFKGHGTRRSSRALQAVVATTLRDTLIDNRGEGGTMCTSEARNVHQKVRRRTRQRESEENYAPHSPSRRFFRVSIIGRYHRNTFIIPVRLEPHSPSYSLSLSRENPESCCSIQFPASCEQLYSIRLIIISIDRHFQRLHALCCPPLRD